MSPKPEIRIHYCPGCRWMLRAAWLAQELLATFEDLLGAVALCPSEEAGTFRILCGEHVLWDRRVEGGFPEAKVLKQRVRDLLQPERDLGHSDRPSQP